MTEAEHQALVSCLRAINSLTGALSHIEGRIKALELAVVALHGRVRLYEAGEVEIKKLTEVH